MINNVFDFGDALAKEVMVPRIDMTSLRWTAAGAMTKPRYFPGRPFYPSAGVRRDHR
ncbi:MAG: hypothetical protein ACLUD0_00330 [Eubacterium ramulus]